MWWWLGAILLVAAAAEITEPSVTTTEAAGEKVTDPITSPITSPATSAPLVPSSPTSAAPRVLSSDVPTAQITGSSPAPGNSSPALAPLVRSRGPSPTNTTGATQGSPTTQGTTPAPEPSRPDSRLLEGNWGRIIVREVGNCYEATNESRIASTTCNKTDTRQIWRLNEQQQLVNFYHNLCLTPSNLDGRDPKVVLAECRVGSLAQKWVATSKSLNDFTLTSLVLQLCLDVNGFAVKRTETVQLGTCENHFDDFGRLSDQYLQFGVSYTQIDVLGTDAIVDAGDAAKLSCLLQNTPKAPDYVIWSNSKVSIEEFSTTQGYSISTGVYSNNSMLSILTIDRPMAPETWTCLFIVDSINFKSIVDVDMPEVSCQGTVSINGLSAYLECCYLGKYPPTRIQWQQSGRSVKETARSYQIIAEEFNNRTQCSTLYLPRTAARLTFSTTFITTYKTVGATVTSGPLVVFETTSPPWQPKSRTTFPTYRIINLNGNASAAGNLSAIESNLTNKATTKDDHVISVVSLVLLLLVRHCT